MLSFSHRPRLDPRTPEIPWRKRRETNYINKMVKQQYTIRIRSYETYRQKQCRNRKRSYEDKSELSIKNEDSIKETIATNRSLYYVVWKIINDFNMFSFNRLYHGNR